MNGTDVRVLVTRVERGLIRKLLDTATEIGVPIAEIRTSPLGYIVPTNVAVKAGLLSDLCPPTLEPEPAPPASRAKRTRKPKTPEPTPGQMAIEEIWSE